MKLTVTPAAFPKQWPVEKPQVKLSFLGTIWAMMLRLFNGIGLFWVTVYYLLPFEMILPGNLFTQFVLFVVGVIIAFYLTILLYEGTYILVGPWLGYVVGMVQVGPLALIRTINGWRLRRMGHDISLVGGTTYSAPRHGKRLRLRYAIYAVSGYTTLVLTLGGLLQLSAVLPADRSPVWATVIINLFVITVTFGIWNQLFQAVSKLATAFFYHPAHRNQLCLETLVAETIHGARPRTLDPVILQQLVAETKESPIESNANHLVYEYEIDRGQVTTAAHYLSQALQALHRCQEPEVRTAILLSAAEYEVLYTKDPQRAREWLAHCQIEDTSPLAHELYQQYLLVTAAILRAEGQWTEARDTALRCQSMLQKSFDLGNLAPKQEKLDKILHETAEMLALRPQAIVQSAHLQFDPPLQPKARVISGLYNWASFAFTYFLLIHFNPISGTQSYLYRHWGNQYASAGQYEQAIVEYTKADNAFPGYAVVAMERGIAYSRIGDYSNAVIDFTEAIEFSWSEEIAHYLWRGEAYYELREYELAEADFAHALSLAYTQRKRQWVIETVEWIRNKHQDGDQSAAVD